MKNIFIDSFKITNNSIILAIPLILFVKVLDLYSMYSKYHLDTTIKFVVASLTVICMFSAFCAGWFYMVKDAIKLSKKVFVLDKDRARATLYLFKSLVDGIGKYFLSFLGTCLIYIFVIQLIATQVVWLIGGKLIGTLDAASMEQLQEISLSAASSNTASMAVLLDKMTPEMITYFGKWSLLFVLVTFIVSYLLMLWIPEIMYKESNPLIALSSSIVKLFKNFFSSFGVYILLWFIGLTILFINTFSIINPFFYLLMSIIMFYFFVYMVVTIFLYYDRKYVNDDEE